MWAEISGGQIIRTIVHPKNLIINGTTYPRQIFQDKDWLKSLGILPYRENSINQRYHFTGSLSYEIGSDEVVGTYAKTDKDFAELKKQMVIQTKETASTLLKRDDWMAIRAIEGGTALPDSIKSFRSKIREESNSKEIEIDALSDLDAVKLYEATPYIETRKTENVDEDGNVTYGDT